MEHSLSSHSSQYYLSSTFFFFFMICAVFGIFLIISLVTTALATKNATYQLLHTLTKAKTNTTEKDEAYNYGSSYNRRNFQRGETLMNHIISFPSESILCSLDEIISCFYGIVKVSFNTFPVFWNWTSGNHVICTNWCQKEESHKNYAGTCEEGCFWAAHLD